MSMLLYEGVVTRPQNPDQGGRRSVPGDCPRGVFSRPAVPKQRADLDTRSAPYRVGLEPAARHKRQRGGERPFRCHSSREQGNADDDRRQDQPWGNTPAPRSHCRSRAAIAECASAFIAHDGLRKRLWRQLNNPIAQRKFPTAIKGGKKLDDFLIDK